MYKIDFPIDAKEAAVISRRRRVEEERKLRIFNPKERIIGKDTCALKIQIQEKRDREQQERDLEEAWCRERNRQQLFSMEMERRQEHDRKKVWCDIQEFRKTCQRFEDRREFDLNDPRRCQYVARLHDEDVRNGPASMQKFEGEDLSYRGRIVNQEIQKKAWLDAQIAEKKQNQQEYEDADRLYQQRLREMALRVNELSKAEEEARKRVETAHKQYNLALAQETAEKKKLQQLADEEATLAHQLNMFHSELLSEVTDATSVNGPMRIGRDKFKGWTEEMHQVIKEEQRQQIAEKKRRDKEEASWDAAWEKMQKRYSLATRILDKEMDCRKKQQHKELTNINKELAEEQSMRNCYINNHLYKGTFTESFFDQFNTSTR